MDDYLLDVLKLNSIKFCVNHYRESVTEYYDRVLASLEAMMVLSMAGDSILACMCQSFRIGETKFSLRTPSK